ncbi:dTMP kinase [Erysipelothrix urinaevulpis]|uniref:dTMP kinase n=1 Tax=Erysipelothrix urinaevulpis TaxID=2683717 RepID=UPI001359D210|nr:dTMP kinase [Erysipelothrix urinaevulpis]
MGYFISFEGPEGSGKSTVIKEVYDYLTQEGYDVIMTREPGGIRIAEEIRNLILNPDHQEMDDRTEALLYAASRRQHVVEKIQPALKANKIVLCDRFIDSSLAYQGYGRDIGIDEVYQINTFAIENCMPNLTLFFDVHPEIGMERIGQRGFKDRLEQAGDTFHERVYEAYHQLWQENPQRIQRIDAEVSLEEVIASSIKKIKEYI